MKLGWVAWVCTILGCLGGLAGLVVGIIDAPLYGSIFAAIFIGIFFAAYWFFIRPIFTSSKIVKSGEQRQGKIIEVWDTNVTVNNNPQIGLLIEVKDGYGKTYQAKTRLVISRLQVGMYSPGTPVVVRVDKHNDQKIAVEQLGISNAFTNSVFSNTTNTSVEKETSQEGLQKILEMVSNQNNELMLTGISAQATVVAYYDLNVKVNGENPFVLLFVKVQPGLKEPFYAHTFGVVGEQALAKFQPGNTITVKYDMNDYSKIVVEHS